jgi:hypothetical protein
MTEEELQEIEKSLAKLGPLNTAHWADIKLRRGGVTVIYEGTWIKQVPKLVAEVRRLQRSVEAWTETAAQHLRNEEYWRTRALGPNHDWGP